MTSLDWTYEKLRHFVQAGWVSRSPLAIASQVAVRHYYQLTVDGFRMWRRDPAALPPTKRFFAPKADATHQHLLLKSKFLTHLTLAAHRRGVRIENDHPENTVGITIDQVTVRPDHILQLVTPDGKRFSQVFEFDRSTETLVGKGTGDDTWSQKNYVYDMYQNQLGKNRRFRVVVVTSRSRQPDNAWRTFWIASDAKHPIRTVNSTLASTSMTFWRKRTLPFTRSSAITASHTSHLFRHRYFRHNHRRCEQYGGDEVANVLASIVSRSNDCG